MPFVHSVQLRFSDADSLGHVNNARYLSFLEDARIACLIHLGELHGSRFHPGDGMIVARIEIDYVRPMVVAAEPARVEVWISRVGTKSFTLGSSIIQADEVVARAVTVLVTYDYAAARSRPLTAAEREVLESEMVAAS